MYCMLSAFYSMSLHLSRSQSLYFYIFLSYSSSIFQSPLLSHTLSFYFFSSSLLSRSLFSFPLPPSSCRLIADVHFSLAVAHVYAAGEEGQVKLFHKRLALNHYKESRNVSSSSFKFVILA